MADKHSFVQSDLRFLLPIESGQQVLIVGDSPELVKALTAENVKVTVITQETNIPLPLNQASIDHILIIQLQDQHLDELFSEVKRILKPQGCLFMGIRNQRSLHTWGGLKKKSHSFLLKQCQQLLAKHQFQLSHCYGIQDDLKKPQFIVSLENRQATRYFFEQIFIPYSWFGAIAQQIAFVLILINYQTMLFKDLGLVFAYNPN